MDRQTLLDTARKLIAEADTGEAIELTTSFLESESRYRLLYREAMQLAARFSKTQADEGKGTVSFENIQISYSQINEGLLNLLENIETDTLHPETSSGAPGGGQRFFHSNRLLILIAVPMLIISAAVLVMLLRSGDSEPEVQTMESGLCSVHFDAGAENILVLPFFKPGGDAIQPEGLIVERLQDFSRQINLKSEIALCEDFEPKFLLDYPEAAEIGRASQAKLIVWGRAEKDAANTVIKTRFKYLGESETLALSRLGWEGEKLVVTDKILSVVATEGELTDNVEAALMLALGLVADQVGDSDAVIAALGAVQVNDSMAVLLRSMLLANNFIALEKPQEALATLDTLLDSQPDFWLGRCNRAMLNIESGDYLAAVEDLNFALEKEPDDAELLYARGAAYFKSDQLLPAKNDFERVIKIKPQRAAEVRENLNETNQRIINNEAVLNQLKVKPSQELTAQDYFRAADASRQLGDTRNSQQFVEKGLALKSNDPQLISIRIDNLLKEKNEAEAAKVLQDAVSRGISKDQITKHSAAARKLSNTKIKPKK